MPMGSTQQFEVADGTTGKGFFLSGVWDNSEISSRFLSSQYNENPSNVDALISMESIEEMREYALQTGDHRSEWKLDCPGESKIELWLN